MPVVKVQTFLQSCSARLRSIPSMTTPGGSVQAWIVLARNLDGKEIFCMVSDSPDSIVNNVASLTLM